MNVEKITNGFLMRLGDHYPPIVQFFPTWESLVTYMANVGEVLIQTDNENGGAQLGQTVAVNI